MTDSIADRSDGWVSRPALSIVRFHPLAALLMLGAAIRLPLAFWPNIIHPDEIFQYLEPSWRILGHEGILSWEWRYGMRGWSLPSLLAGPVGLGDWLAPGGTGAFVAPRLVAALASLSIVASAWVFGARVSRTHAIVAAFVAAIWFEFVLFAPHTLSEPLATALILPAALLLTNAPSSQRQLAIGGALLALAFGFRFQYAPAIAVLALGTCWGQWRNLIPIISGGLAALLFAGLADAANGAAPFGWLIANVQQNFLNDRAAEFGVMPALTYFNSFLMMWSGAIVLLSFAIWQGWRHAPLLLATAVANVSFHSVIGHKEYRFIFLSVALLIIIAALGSADWIQWLRAKRGWRRVALPMVAGGWALISAALAATGTTPGYWMNGIKAAQLGAELRADPALCGLALYNTPFPLLPGRDRLVGRSPLYTFDPNDPAVSGNLAAAAVKAAPAFNRIITRRELATDLPAGFSQRDCAGGGASDLCIFARSGGCDAGAGTPFVINDVLMRVDH